MFMPPRDMYAFFGMLDQLIFYRLVGKSIVDLPVADVESAGRAAFPFGAIFRILGSPEFERAGREAPGPVGLR